MNLKGIPESTHYQEATSSFIRAANDFLRGSMDPLSMTINRDPTPYSPAESLGSSGLSRSQLNHILKMINDYHSGKLNLNDKLPRGHSYDNNWFHMFNQTYPDHQPEYDY